MNIHAGYELETGRRVAIPLGHLVVTGQTQESGKTTTLEALITRAELTAVAFVTKRGEKSFRLMREIAPYFQERADWQFVQAVLEASTKQKQTFKEAWIMRAAESARTLEEVQRNVRRFIHGERGTVANLHYSKRKRGADKEPPWKLRPARGLSADMYYVLDHYFDEVIPEIRRLKASDKLELKPGINVMDLSGYSSALQALVIRSVIERVYQKMRGVVTIIPEAWEFIPNGRGGPVKLAAFELIRKGGAERNYVWLDSQDIAGVDHTMLRQMKVWIFGVQRDPLEVERTLRSIPDLPRPKAKDISLLGRGQFIVAHGAVVSKIYVQPAGMEDAHAEAIALGEERADSWKAIVRDLDSPTDPIRPPADTENLGVSDQKGIDLHPGNGDRKLDDAEDPVWKERYEELEKKYQQQFEVNERLAARVRELEGKPPVEIHHQPFTVKQVDGAGLEEVYFYVKARAAKEDPKTLALLYERPELRVTVQRKTVEADSSTTKGRLALLISQKFFDAARPVEHIREEFIRRGWLPVKTNNKVFTQRDALPWLLEAGFLSREADGYMAVHGMRVSITGDK